MGVRGKEAGIILAGGQGKRMDLLCHLRPKPALPFAGKLRVIDFSLSNCIHSKIRNIAVLVDYQRSYMAEYLGEWAEANAGSATVSVLPPASGSFKGTADAVYQNLAYLNIHKIEKVLILAGDHIYRMDYRKIIDFHDRVNADVTVGVIQVPIEEAYRFGTVLIDSDSKIQEFVEKSKNPLSTLASMGIYVFNRDILVNRLTEDAGIESSPHDFGYAILPHMVKHDKVFAYEFNGYWQDIGTIEAYYQANMELLEERPRFSLNSDWPVLSDHAALPALEGSKSGKVVNSLISSGCIIDGHVENSVLSPGVHVAEQAIIRNSIVMTNSVIGHHSIVDSFILDEGVKIGRFCYIGFGNTLLPGNWDITVLGKDVVVPPLTSIGRKCRILPKAGPSELTGGVIPSDTIIRAGVRNR